MRLNRFGEYDYVVDRSLTARELEPIDELDGIQHPDEDKITDVLFWEDGAFEHDPVLGYYPSLYCRHVRKGDFRAKGSSGGMATWLLAELLRTGEVDGADGVVAVVHTSSEATLYQHPVLRSAEELRAGAKSRYYPVEMSAALREIREVPGKYALVGIPTFISDLRRLQQSDSTLRERITYTVSLLCGLQKSTKYGESIAFEAGIPPGGVSGIDFRFKTGAGLAST